MTQGRNVTAEKHGCIKVRKNGRTKKKKKETCNLYYNVTLLQNESINDVARFATHIKPVLKQIRFLAGLMWVVKTRNIRYSIRFAAMVQDKSHVFLLPVFPPNDGDSDDDDENE